MKKQILCFGAIFLLFLTSCGVIPKAEPPERQDIEGTNANLLHHPDKVTLKGKNSKLYYLYFSLEKKSLFISDNDTMYTKISEWLPLISNENHYVILEGSPIDPFTLFEKGQLEATIEKRGLKLNAYKVNWIFNISLKSGPVNFQRQSSISPQTNSSFQTTEKIKL